MSGGHYNYAYFKIQTLAEEILSDIESTKDGEGWQVLSDEVKVAMRKLVTELEAVAKKAKSLEWFLSGDYGEEDFLKEMLE